MLNVFERVEEKYLLTPDKYHQLLKKIDSHLVRDNYFQTTICNIYFDSSENDLIINSLEKPLFKEKVRLRSYGIPNLKDEVFLEIKSKYKGIVGKRRIKLTLEEFNNFLKTKKLLNSSQIARELTYLFDYYQLKPNYYIAYDRESYVGVDDSGLRITFDTNLRSRREDLALEYGDAGKRFFDDDIYIMEIKTLNALPLWLSKTLSDLNIYPATFSKYGSIYQKEREAYVC